MSSVTITFVAGTSTDDKSSVVIELDSEKNNNRTIFSYGDKAYFRVYYVPSCSLYIAKTDGFLTEEGYGNAEFNEFVSFLTSQESKLSKPAINIINSQWFGNSLGRITLEDPLTIKCEKKPEPTGSNGIGLAKITYTSQFKRYAISIPEKQEDQYNVSIYITSQG